MIQKSSYVWNPSVGDTVWRMFNNTIFEVMIMKIENGIYHCYGERDGLFLVTMSHPLRDFFESESDARAAIKADPILGDKKQLFQQYADRLVNLDW